MPDQLELYHRYRPKTFDEVVGQAEAIKSIKSMLKEKRVPHALMLTGPSGVGKTTIARILCTELGCMSYDYNEINCAAIDGVMETVRDIQQAMQLAPMTGSCRIWLLDEVQSLSRATFAQQAMLKMLEDVPRHVYFILATTDPEKVIKTIRTRCTELSLGPIPPKNLRQLLCNVIEKEFEKETDYPTPAVIDSIVKASEGSARKALVLLHQIMGLESEEEQIHLVASADNKGKAFDIVCCLLYKKPIWTEVVKAIKACEGEDHEKMRHFILACARTELLKGNEKAVRAYLILDVFGSNWYDCPESGLIKSCWEVLSNCK